MPSPWCCASAYTEDFSPEMSSRCLARRIGTPDRAATALQGHGEVRADRDHIALPPLLQAGQEVRVIAVIGVGGHAGPADTQAFAWSNNARAIWGFVWNTTSWGTWALVRRAGSLAQTSGRYRRVATGQARVRSA